MYSGQDVSVVIPSHNRPGSLKRSIESVISQTISIGEIIVINDGSTTSYDEIEKFLHDIQLDTKYYQTDGIGASAARNLGANASSGKVLMFLDDDDYWHQKKCTRQLNLLNDQIGLVYSGRVVVDQTCKELYRIGGGNTGDLSKKILFKNIIGTTSGPAIRRDLFEEVGGFDETMPGYQDWELWIRICQHTHIGYDPMHTIYWTYHTENKDQMTAQVARYLDAIDVIRNKHKKKLQDLSWINKRKIRSHDHQALAKKYAGLDSRKKIKHVFLSIISYPSMRATARLLPDSYLIKIRSAITNN